MTLEAGLRVIATVWTAETLGIAIFAGALLGFVVFGYLATRPTYASEAGPEEVGAAIGISGILSGLVFYLGQALVDYREDIPERLISRFGVWCLYSIAVALGTYLRIRIFLWRHRRKVSAEATREVDEKASRVTD